MTSTTNFSRDRSITNRSLKSAGVTADDSGRNPLGIDHIKGRTGRAKSPHTHQPHVNSAGGGL
jgi:hypothetical protein